jgi:hypothetical protein
VRSGFLLFKWPTPFSTPSLLGWWCHLKHVHDLLWTLPVSRAHGGVRAITADRTVWHASAIGVARPPTLTSVA